MMMTTEVGLSEKAIDTLEASIPTLAAAATRAACARAMLAGLTVLKVEDAHIVACTADGTVRVIGEVPQRRKVQIGKAITVRRVIY